MSKLRVIVVRAAGINCDEETMHCWRLVGAEPSLRHVNELAEKPALLDACDILTVPGGFSYGDDIAAGVILAQRFEHDLREPIDRLLERGGGVLGICNGFQVLVKMGLLPGGAFGREAVTVTYNDSAHFEARWVKMEVATDRCVFLEAGDTLEMPVEHAEGKVQVAADSVVDELAAAGQIAVRYVDEAGRHDTYPANPNGSSGGIAGLCDPTGRVFALMPHPDRHFDHAHHPQWTRRQAAGDPDGLKVFRRAAEHWG